VYYYAHLEAYAPHLTEGEYVTPQTLLGYVGTTGNAAGTPPHLHFGVYESTHGALNPLPLLSDRPEEKKPTPAIRPARVKKRRQTQN
nr:peptidoglycan DD-metalloendopeptidase family protein [Acidobacteriota bacterium]